MTSKCHEILLSWLVREVHGEDQMVHLERGTKDKKTTKEVQLKVRALIEKAGKDGVLNDLDKIKFEAPDKDLGNFGPRTERAMMQLQKAMGLKVTGKVDDEDLAKLDKVLGLSPSQVKAKDVTSVPLKSPASSTAQALSGNLQHAINNAHTSKVTVYSTETNTPRNSRHTATGFELNNNLMTAASPRRNKHSASNITPGAIVLGVKEYHDHGVVKQKLGLFAVVDTGGIHGAAADVTPGVAKHFNMKAVMYVEEKHKDKHGHSVIRHVPIDPKNAAKYPEVQWSLNNGGNFKMIALGRTSPDPDELKKAYAVIDDINHGRAPLSKLKTVMHKEYVSLDNHSDRKLADIETSMQRQVAQSRNPTDLLAKNEPRGGHHKR